LRRARKVVGVFVRFFEKYAYHKLNSNTDEIFDIEKDQRTALIKAAGMFSRPDRDELSRRKKTED
jgi:hypothetical protein